jgi:hypothetical protein
MTNEIVRTPHSSVVKKRHRSTVKKENKENVSANSSTIFNETPHSTTKTKRAKKMRLENIETTAQKLNLNKI